MHAKMGGKNVLEQPLAMAQSGRETHSEYREYGIVSLGWKVGCEKWRSLR